MKTALSLLALLVFCSVSMGAIEFSDDDVTDATAATATDDTAGEDGSNTGLAVTGSNSGTGPGEVAASAAAVAGSPPPAAIGSSVGPDRGVATIGTPGETTSDAGGGNNNGDDGTPDGRSGDDTTPPGDDGSTDGGGTQAAVPEPAAAIIWSVLALCSFGLVRVLKR